MSKKIKNFAILIEFIVGSGLAIFFHQILHYPEAAYTIFGIGILLSLVTYLIREDIEKTGEGLLEHYHRAHELTFAVVRISNPECQNKAQELLASAMGTMSLLQQGYIPMDEVEFYLEGVKQMGHAVNRVKAADRVTTEWDSRGVLHNFYQSNLRAIERGVKITRIFVVDHTDLTDSAFQKVLLTQYCGGIDVRVAFHDELPSATDITSRNTDSSFDFAIYDNRMITDVFSKPGKYFGRKTSEPVEVEKYIRLYELVENSAYPITTEDDKVMLAGEVFPIAESG